MSISTAIGSERKERTAGYRIKQNTQDAATVNLPQIVVVLGEANLANQGTLSTTATEVTSADQAGKLYGYGSPIHQMMRILRPQNSDGIGGIPTIVMAQASDGSASQTTRVWTITGTATANATHKLVIAGRNGLDFQTYSYAVATGDTPTVTAGKILAAVNAVAGAPVILTNSAGVVTVKSKWAGATSAELSVSVDNGGKAAGVTYAQTSITDGAGDISLAGALAQFGDNWYTAVINPYADQLDELEAFNGFPDDTTPTGRYQGSIFKPFMAFFGSTVKTQSDFSTITNASARRGQCTNVLCPAPGSKGFSWEAAANMVRLWARTMQDTPELDVSGQSYPDMPLPADGDIGDMADYNSRDALVKLGCSTVALINGQYQVQSLVTTYHPDGLNPLTLKFDYCRNLNIDFEVKDGHDTLQRLYVRDKVLLPDNQVSSSANIVQPKTFKSVLFQYFDELADRALIKDSAYSKASVQVEIDGSNPNRFNDFFRYQRSGFGRIASTDAEVSN